MRVAIYGSCITRDAVEHWPEHWELVDYRARHPLGSLPAPSVLTREDLAAAPAGWRRLQHTGDIASTSLTDMMTTAPDLIIWDLVSERHGVHIRPDGGRALGGDIAYQSSEYAHMWIEGLAEFDRLRAGVPVVLNAIDWDLADPRSHTFATWQNWAANQAREFGIAVARTLSTRADAAQKWGPAPFHLRQQDYVRSVQAIEREVRQCGSAR